MKMRSIGLIGLSVTLMLVTTLASALVTRGLSYHECCALILAHRSIYGNPRCLAGALADCQIRYEQAESTLTGCSHSDILMKKHECIHQANVTYPKSNPASQEARTKQLRFCADRATWYAANCRTTQNRLRARRTQCEQEAQGFYSATTGWFTACDSTTAPGVWNPSMDFSCNAGIDCSA